MIKIFSYRQVNLQFENKRRILYSGIINEKSKKEA